MPYDGQNEHTSSAHKRTFARSFRNCLATKVLTTAYKVAAEDEKLQRRSYDGLRFLNEWPNGVLPSEPNINISFFVCPSGVNFRTA